MVQTQAKWSWMNTRVSKLYWRLCLKYNIAEMLKSVTNRNTIISDDANSLMRDTRFTNPENSRSIGLRDLYDTRSKYLLRERGSLESKIDLEFRKSIYNMVSDLIPKDEFLSASEYYDELFQESLGDLISKGTSSDVKDSPNQQKYRNRSMSSMQKRLDDLNVIVRFIEQLEPQRHFGIIRIRMLIYYDKYAVTEFQVVIEHDNSTIEVESITVYDDDYPASDESDDDSVIDGRHNVDLVRIKKTNHLRQLQLPAHREKFLTKPWTYERKGLTIEVLHVSFSDSDGGDIDSDLDSINYQRKRKSTFARALHRDFAATMYMSRKSGLESSSSSTENLHNIDSATML